MDRISHKIDGICPIYFYNKPILPDCETNIARLALFAQQTGGLPHPRPGTPMQDGGQLINFGLNISRTKQDDKSVIEFN